VESANRCQYPIGRMVRARHGARGRARGRCGEDARRPPVALSGTRPRQPRDQRRRAVFTIDLTQATRNLLKLTDRDIVIAIATGGIGSLVKKLWDAVTPSSPPSVVDQLEALRKLIRDCKEAGVTRITAKISQPAFKQFTASVRDAKIDVEQVFQDACVFTVEFA
jgi:hypothetical protein